MLSDRIAVVAQYIADVADKSACGRYLCEGTDGRDCTARSCAFAPDLLIGGRPADDRRYRFQAGAAYRQLPV